MCADIEYSDDESQVDRNAYKTETLAFGKYKGSTFAHMIKTPLTRGYLKYLLRWDELKPTTRAHIQNALASYTSKKEKHDPKKKSRQSRSPDKESPKRSKCASPE